MAKRISVSIPDEMFEKMSELKKEFTDSMSGKEKVSRKISSICQRAIGEAIKEAEVSRIYRLEGMRDGEKAAKLLSENDKKIIAKTLRGEGPYRKWSLLERVNVLEDHFGSYAFIKPKFHALFDGRNTLHEWVQGDSQLAEDRRSEMTWSYIEGCYQGILDSFQDGK